MDRRRTTIVLGVILVAALLLRLYKVTALALWFDEAASLKFSSYSWPALFQRLRMDFGAPLYFVVLKLWCGAFGRSVFALRMLSVTFGVAGVLVVFMFVREVFRNERLALLSALMLAVNPFQIEYAHETRMYTMGAFMVLLASYFLARAIRVGRPADWFRYALAAAGCLYTHYYLLFAIGSQALVAVGASLARPLDRRWKMLLSVVGAYAVAALAFAPWLPAFFEQQRHVSEDFWIRPLQFETVVRIPWSVLFGTGNLWTPMAWLCVVAVAALALMAISVRRAHSWGEWLVIGQALLPIGAGLALSIHRPIIDNRYFTFASAFWSIIVARAVMMPSRPVLRRAIAALVIVVTLAALAKNLNALHLVAVRHAAVAPPGIAGASDYINRRAGAGDAIVVSNSLIYFSFNYYNRATKALLYTGTSLDAIPLYGGRGLLSRGELIGDLRAMGCPRRVWYLWTDGFYAHKIAPPGEWRLVSESRFADMPDFKGMIFVDEYVVPPAR